MFFNTINKTLYCFEINLVKPQILCYTYVEIKCTVINTQYNSSIIHSYLTAQDIKCAININHVIK